MIRPSGMDRVMGCPASVSLCRGRASTEDSTVRNEGNEAHDYGKRILKGEMSLADVPDLEMRNNLGVYTNVALAYINTAGQYAIEETYKTLFGGTEVAGVPDTWAVGPVHGLTVIDLKYGYRPVDPDSWQLITYACMIWYAVWQRNWTPCKVNLIVVQPRGSHPDGPVRKFSFDGDLLRGYFNQVSNAIALATVENPTASAGVHCYRCPAILDCRANSLACLGAMDVAMRGELFDSNARMSTELDDLYRAKGLLKNRLVAAEEHVQGSIVAGQTFPGWGMVAGKSALKWVLPDPIAGAEEMGVDLRKPSEPITPTQALNRKLITEDQIKFMARREPTGPKLKKIDFKLADKLIKGKTS